MSNVLLAFLNIVNNPITSITSHYKSNNRANQMGDAVDSYVKDIFSDSIGLDAQSAIEKHNQVFSFLGTQNNPPDMIIRGGDAIEVKKIESMTASLALNSSYPKDYLYSSSTMITKDCRDCESPKWSKKDIIYCIGIAKNNVLKGMWFVYGNCYAAEGSIYENLRTQVINGILSIPNVDFAETNELGRVNKLDPLKLTHLRIRNMWGLDNPINAFNYLNLNTDSDFFAHLIIKKEKYDSMPEKDKIEIENLVKNNNSVNLQSVNLKDPNNASNNISSIVLSYNK